MMSHVHQKFPKRFYLIQKIIEFASLAVSLFNTAPKSSFRYSLSPKCFQVDSVIASAKLPVNWEDDYPLGTDWSIMSNHSGSVHSEYDDKDEEVEVVE
jgi:hypothetical protein